MLRGRQIFNLVEEMAVLKCIECRKLTPPEVAKQLGVSEEKVRAWILAGELRAMNAATKCSGRPSYKIEVQDLLDFEQRRQVVAGDHRPIRRQKRARKTTSIKEYF